MDGSTPKTNSCLKAAQLGQEGTLRATRDAPVTVVAKGELTVVHQKIHRLSRNACDAESSKNNCSMHSMDHKHVWRRVFMDALIVR